MLMIGKLKVKNYQGVEKKISTQFCQEEASVEITSKFDNFKSMCCTLMNRVMK